MVVLLWAAVIFTMSTDTFSADHTAAVISTLRWFYPALTEDRFAVIHHFIRKFTHFSGALVASNSLCSALQGGIRTDDLLIVKNLGPHPPAISKRREEESEERIPFQRDVFSLNSPYDHDYS
jgi:hypothetical protein